MKVSELEGSKLAEWVARANGWPVERDGDWPDATLICTDPTGMPHSFGEYGYRPDLNWAQAGPIIERESICIMRGANQEYSPGWSAFVGEVGACELDDDYGWQRGEVALMAAMRAFVWSKYGDTVPDEAA